ncbi:Vibriobactin utilization protein ViuB [Actinomadura rubteroloni]|uniref:Vibriobactin utilization protein ViuB n=1 Tax=Actinomadura rubteroloni TaxID=1926885 RepID=A0A2P4UBN3_9ACTN|nr:siderophore-interacting protein [Actinomadura rubteroloni]POM22456.1 Vibriobactin utilization protein ViuB [Actinomadura rubteroloni]
MATERKGPSVSTATVLRTRQLTPHMIRVVLGGPGLADFGAGEYTDHYVKLLFPQPGVRYPEPFDIAAVRAEYPRDQWPVTRTYTVRSYDRDAGELTLDFVYHGDTGLAGPWAKAARPGDEILFLGPGGAYAPDPDADWHLLAGDESALPAIAAALERIGDGVPVRAFVEVADAAERQDIKVPGGAELTWLERSGRPVGEALVAAVRALEFPAGTVHAFVHGEAGFVRDLRRYLRVERGIPLDRLSISGYWRTGRDEDGWQSSKREWNRQVEEEEARALG